MSVNVECILKNAATTIGEGPHWDESTQCLLHVDIHGNNVHRWNSVTGQDEKIHFDDSVGFVVPCRKGGCIIGLGRTLSHYDWDTKKTTVLHEVDKGTRNRFNDAKCDPTGRLWAGTMGFILPDEAELKVEETGYLFTLESDGSLKKHLDDIHISNGLAWTRDRKTMYYIDSIPRKVFAFDYDAETGNIRNQRVAVDFAVKSLEEYGFPDGMAIDSDDMLWVAGFGSHKIMRFNPKTGEELTSVKFPTPKITSCCFGGKNFDDLYVTCAAETTEEDKKKYPLSGSVFRVTGLGVKGLPAPIYEN